MGQYLNLGCMLAAKSPREHRSSCHHGLQGHSDHILECVHSIHPQCGHPGLQGAQLSLAMQPYYSSGCQVLSSWIAAVLPALQPTIQMLLNMNADFTRYHKMQSMQLIYRIYSILYYMSLISVYSCTKPTLLVQACNTCSCSTAGLAENAPLTLSDFNFETPL